MEITAVQGRDERWDQAVWESPGGTIFHTLRFQSYHPASKFEFRNLAVADGGDLVCVLPGGLVKSGGRRSFRTPLGASFGGPVFRDDRDLRTMSHSIDLIHDHLRSIGCDAVDMILAPLCYHRNQSQGLQFMLTAAGYRLEAREATLVVPLAVVGDSDLHPSLLRNVRKAGRSGVEISTASDLRGVYAVLTKNLEAKGARATHSMEELRTLVDLFPGRFVALEATASGRVVGGCVLILCNPRVGLAFYICDDPDRRDLRVAEAVLHAALMRLKQMGYAYLDLGTASMESRMNWGLLRFKAKFGARVYVRECYHLDLEGLNG
jgi:hypothetical protein